MSITLERVLQIVERAAGRLTAALRRSSVTLVLVLAVAAIGYAVQRHPLVVNIARGETGIRTNRWLGTVHRVSEGNVLMIPGLYELRRYPLRDQVYHPQQGQSASGPAPFQSVEGLSIGVDLSVRYALDPDRILAMADTLPDDVAGEIVQPAVQGVIYKVFTRYTVREIFSTKREEIQQTIETELKPRLAFDGIQLRSVQIGQIDLPPDYRAGMERLLAEELASDKMRFTLELKDKQVAAAGLDAQADKVRRETAAEAAGNEQVIAAKAQEEAMKHVLPFKQKQIEQRQLEAEAEKVSRIKTAEGSAEARRIEAAGEADSRLKLADAEAYRLERLGKTSSEQMERDGVLLTKNPLLIQKIMADKLSDKVQVIIAAPPANGGFIGGNLIGMQAARSDVPVTSGASEGE